jgi:hypothetical protein
MDEPVFESWLTSLVVAALAVAAIAGCAPADAESVPTPEEEAACATLERSACGAAAADATGCGEAMAERRPGAECGEQWDAWVACVGSLSACPEGSGVPCPTEYSALGACMGGAL